MKNFPFIVEQGEENVNNYKQRTNKANMKIVGNVFQVIVRDGQITPTTHKIYLRSFFYILLPEQSILQRNQWWRRRFESPPNYWRRQTVLDAFAQHHSPKNEK